MIKNIKKIGNLLIEKGEQWELFYIVKNTKVLSTTLFNSEVLDLLTTISFDVLETLEKEKRNFEKNIMSFERKLAENTFDISYAESIKKVIEKDKTILNAINKMINALRTFNEAYEEYKKG
ncbi:MAG: hypothetical protein QXJ14_02580 [Candidatus Aenigmatarchaeota archaeon]